MVSPFEQMTLRPHWMQFCIGQLFWICLCTTLYVIYLMTNFVLHEVLAYLSGAIMVYLTVEILSMSRIRYIVTGEQIVYLHGLLVHKTDYMELYRVIDYQQHSTLMQQLAGLKTITVMSGDRNMPALDIIGIRQEENVVHEIRKRVEYNKKIKSIYEVTNRF